ncbi:MAG: FtsB family cell division protein [Bacteriovoracia bacterium]
MQNQYDDEFEDVPSPFRKSTAASRMAAQPKGNLFSRPLGTAPSEAPTITEAPTRRSPARPDQLDFMPQRRVATTPQVEYLDEEEEDEEEEEVVERRPARVKSAKPKNKNKEDLLPRIGWAIIGVLMLRLVFMERGVIDYVGMNGKITERETELARVQAENDSISAEIRRITLDKSYQRQITKEILGVIAADEFLILFAGESSETPAEVDRQL